MTAQEPNLPDGHPPSDGESGPGNVTCRLGHLRVRVTGHSTVVVMAAIVIVVYLVIAWTLRRGFDWTDEAFVMSMVASNRISVGEPWGFQHLLHPLYVLTGESVLVFRILRLAGYLALSVVLVGCARVVARRVGVVLSRTGWVFALLLAQVGTFLAWSYPPRYLSHNELASWFAQAGVALVVVALATGAAEKSRAPDRRLWLPWLGAGACLAVLVFAKVTSGAAFAVLLTLAVLAPNPYLQWWKRWLAAATGGVAVLAAVLASGYPVVSYVRNVTSMMTNSSAQAAFAHPISALIPSYIDSILTTGTVVLPLLVLFILMAVALVWAHGGAGEPVLPTRIAWVFLGLLSFALLALPRADTWNYLGALAMFSASAGLVGLIIHDGTARPRETRVRGRAYAVVVGAFGFVVAPFIASAGTNGFLVGHAMFSATLWVLVLGIALALLDGGARAVGSRARAVPSVLAILVLVIAGIAVRAHTERPYRSSPLASQTTPATLPALRGLLLTEAEVDWIGWVAAVGEANDADGVPAVGIGAPGGLYAFNNSAYANPWMDQMWPASFESLRVACFDDPPDDLFVIQPTASGPDDPSTAGMTASLAQCGIAFPGDFRVVDRYVGADPVYGTIIWRLGEG